MPHINADCKFDQGLLAHTELEDVSRSLKAIAHPTRLQILCTLGEREVSVQDIIETVGTSQSNISQHLGIMRSKGVVVSRKVANRVYYRIDDSVILKMVGANKGAAIQKQAYQIKEA